MDSHAKSKFLWLAAECGSNLVAPLARLGQSSLEVESISSKISLASSLFLEACKDVNKNSKFFNDSFPEKLEIVTLQCIKEFGGVRDALLTIASYEKNPNITVRNHATMGKPLLGVAPSMTFRKLLWAMGMDQTLHGLEKLEDRLDKCISKAWMVHSLVSLVCIQKFAQERDLDDTELATLLCYKQQMRKLLYLLRESEVASVMAFKLEDNTVQAVNASQLARENQEHNFTDDASTVTVSTMSQNFTNMKKGSAIVPPPPPPTVKITYEMYRFSQVLELTDTYHTAFKFPLFSIPFTAFRTTCENRGYMTKVPTTEAEVKAYMTANIANNVLGIDALLGLPSVASSHIYGMVEKKNDDPKVFPKKVWSVKSVTPTYGPSKPSNWLNRRRKAVEPIGYVVIIGGEHVHAWPPGPPPPPPNWSKPSERIERSCKLVTPVGSTSFLLTKREIEDVINDFLASVSTLYDGVPAEKRCKVFRELESDDNSDASSFDSSSLIDD